LNRLHGQTREVVVRIDVLLKAVDIHGLTEVAGPVEQPHTQERQTEV
jgi:hypothetical protein